MSRPRTCELYIAALLALGACAPQGARTHKLEGRTMGTSYHITIARTSLKDVQVAALQSDIDTLLAMVNKKMSTYDPHSELSRFNDTASLSPYPVSFETLKVVRSALTFASETDGAFDPTIGPLVDLWGFGPRHRADGLPSDDSIREALAAIGWRRLTVGKDPPTLRKAIPNLRVDLSAIAKGYGVDAVGHLLDSRGLHDYLVEIGGEVFARGRNGRNVPWTLGIDTPEPGAAPGAQFSAKVSLKDAALATSGDYRNYFSEDGKRYAHFIDPRTGRPVTHHLASVSVIAPTCMEADAAATAVMVMGLEKGRTFIEGHPGWEALFLTAEPDGGFKKTATSAFPDSL